MNCSGGGDDSQDCRDKFNECSDSIVDDDDWKGLPLPDVPGLSIRSLAGNSQGKILILNILK